ncbi:MAG: DUF6448 family protein [Gemmatimonadales bacterium]|jgi:hypothetical protein
MKRATQRLLQAFLPLALVLTATAPAAAHCDSLDGPVVTAARRALETGDVSLVLVWVRRQDEPEIRDAFRRTLSVRGLSDDARELADYYFFETLVRVHRAGEGEPYTGLKPAGYEPSPGIAAADSAVEAGALDGLDDRLAGHAAAALQDRFERVLALKAYEASDLEAGRAYVRAYVEFIHFVEHLHALIHEDGATEHAHGTGSTQHDAH